MNDHLKGPSSESTSSDKLTTRVQALEAQRDQVALLVRALRQELHDGLSQQIVGVAMMAARLADDLKLDGPQQAEKAEQLAAAIEDAKRQTFVVAERLKQM